MKARRSKSQQGIVSIMVTMIMMIVITLIVLGFSQVARHNEREALDSQLGAQAYYAAESGINAAQTYITNQITNGQPFKITDCKGAGATFPVPGYINTATSGTNSIGYTCVLINPSPGSLVVNNVGQTTSSVLHAQSSSGNFSTLTFQWQPDTTSGGSANCSSQLGQYPTIDPNQSPTWNCEYSLLRVDILKTPPNGGDFSATNLANNTVSLYLQPSTASNNVTISNISGAIKAYQGSCVPNGGWCSVTVDVSAAAATAADYYLRLSTIYQDAPTVQVTGTTSGGPVNFVNGQVVIDSTGRAQDQLKRLQVRVPLNVQGNTLAPSYGIVSTGEICKDLSITASPAAYYVGNCQNDQPGWPNVGSTQY